MTLTERRRSMDMSLGELARKCNLGTSVMSQIERGSLPVHDAVLGDIAKALDWSIDELKGALPSPEDARKNREHFEALTAAFAACQNDAKEKGFRRGNGGRGSVECPACKGTLRYSVASVTGHMWGRCSTEGCVSWMQ